MENISIMCWIIVVFTSIWGGMFIIFVFVDDVRYGNFVSVFEKLFIFIGAVIIILLGVLSYMIRR